MNPRPHPGRAAAPAIAVVGVPGGRRLELFGAAARAAGLPEPVVLPWRELAAGPVAVPPGALVRVDSPGGEPETERLLRGLKRPLDPHRVEGTAAWYAGFRAALHRLAAAAAAAPGARLVQDPAELAVMCDKRACQQRLGEAGVPVPPALPGGPVSGYAELRRRMAEHGRPRVFVKPAHGSSASGVVALTAWGERVRATTSVELVRTPAGVELYNNLRVRTYTRPHDAAALVDALCADGVRVEGWLPKASLDGRTIDLRVLVVAGRATHTVVRAATGPITNLHLGAERGDPARLRAAMGAGRWRSALAVAERAAGCFPATLHAAVDLLVSPCLRRFAVCEVNAFGDLLPGVLSPEGRDSYAEQLHAMYPSAPPGALQVRPREPVCTP
ncbi:STM4014 family protein [Allonocardiopsis opalescens]|uniref:ATP-grasp domain-containing protein n=1 Tax=Allonocardiopsis opalescens TaxID=1144618 RepID=A0A2T0PU96_9ACTN|nr:STM4014 family protein [Allonocardiopsis opalescens]PRX92460.1 hypothetical protein CLV72_110221 [Allonocardiopsis opalescens]